MRHLTFTPEDLDALRYDRYHHPHPRVQQKREVLWLKSQGLTHTAIGSLAGVSRRSVQRYLDEFADGGLERLRQLAWKGTANELAEHQASLEDYFLENPPRSAREAQAAIAQQTGVHRGRTQGGAPSKKTLGLCWSARSATSSRPSADPEAQADFREDETPAPPTRQAQRGQRTVLFVDAAHFVYGLFLATAGAWRAVRPRLPPAASGTTSWPHATP